ncbi:MAG: tellurite resistance TerB family protein [Aureliella sp.]
MDPIDILGGLLGGGSKGGGSLGGKILKDLMGGGRRHSPPSHSSSPSRGRNRHVDIDSQAKSLEDLLGVAKERYDRSSRDTRPVSQPEPSRRESPSRGGFSFDDRPPVVGRREEPDQNEEALILIRAMINAAKSDGRVTADEQQEIVQRISSSSREAMDFLRNEFSRSMNVRDFAWSVPLGLEQKVYMLSLAAIDLDSQKEASYLKELAHGLRLDPDFCNQLHQQYGIPTLY